MSIPSLLPYNHKNNLLINSETLHTKSQQRHSKVLILLRWKMIGVNDVSLVNCYFTASLKVKTFLRSVSFGEVKKIYVCHGIPLVEKEIDFKLKNWQLHLCSRATPPRKLFFPDFPPLIFFIPSIAIELMWAIGKVNACSLDHWIVPKQFLCRNLVALLLAGGSNFVYFKHLHLELEQRNVFCNSTFAQSGATAWNIFLQCVYLQQVEMYFCKA